MPNPFVEEAGPQPPGAQGPVEIQANLRLLQDSRDSLLITFADRNQRFQSFLVDIDRDRGWSRWTNSSPTPANVSAERRGVSRRSLPRRACVSPGNASARCSSANTTASLLLGRPSRRSALPPAPQRLPRQHQAEPADRRGNRRGETPRAAERTTAGIPPPAPSCASPAMSPNACIPARSTRLQRPVATGARSARDRTASRAFRRKLDATFAGVRFSEMSGLAQRQVDRFVYQLQREARRFEKTNCSESHRTTPSAARRGRSSGRSTSQSAGSR